MARNSSQSTHETFNFLLQTKTSSPLITSSHVLSARATNQQRNHLTHQKQCTITPNVYRQNKKPNNYDIQNSHNHMEKSQEHPVKKTVVKWLLIKCAGACRLATLSKANWPTLSVNIDFEKPVEEWGTMM